MTPRKLPREKRVLTPKLPDPDPESSLTPKAPSAKRCCTATHNQRIVLCCTRLGKVMRTS